MKTNEPSLLKFGNSWIIAVVEQAEENWELYPGGPDCEIHNAYEIIGENYLNPIKFPQWTDEREIAIRSSEISVMCKPNKELTDYYYTLIMKEQE